MTDEQKTANKKKQPGGRPFWARLAAASIPVLALGGLILVAALMMTRAFSPDSLPDGLKDDSVLLGIFLIAMGAAVVYLLWRVPQWQAAAWAEQNPLEPRERFTIENESRATLGQILSGVAVLAGLLFAWQQLGSTNRSVNLSQEGQITDRFTRAVEQISSDKLSVRLGGIYALERIARDSPRDYAPTMEVLSGFVRETTAVGPGTPVSTAPPPSDVVAALTVIARRTPDQMAQQAEEGMRCINLEGAHLQRLQLLNGVNFSGVCLQRANLSGAVLNGADFTGSELQAADLSSAKLEGADFTEAELQGSDFTGAYLVEAHFNNAGMFGANLEAASANNADFSGAVLSSANMTNAFNASDANFSNADFTGAKLTGAVLQNADLLTARRLGREQLATAFTDGAKLPELLPEPTTSPAP